MDQLEGFLQCFDEEDREHIRFGVDEWSEDDTFVIQFMHTRAIRHSNIKAYEYVHDLISNSPDTLYYFPGWAFTEFIRTLYDRGFRTCKVISSHKPSLQQFLQSRDCARSAAIVVMGCVGKRDVGRIIGRVIWASRGIKEWL